jgi:hypothetical protein
MTGSNVHLGSGYAIVESNRIRETEGMEQMADGKQENGGREGIRIGGPGHKPSGERNGRPPFNRAPSPAEDNRNPD